MSKYLDTTKLSIREIDRKIARDMIIKNHYSQKWTKCSVALGLYYSDGTQHKFFDMEDEKLIGVICYGDPIGRHSGASISTEIPRENVYELVRLFIYDGYGDNIESYLIGQGFKWLKENQPHIKALISYADPQEGHVGTIYQATNWIYQGNRIRPNDSWLFKWEEEGEWQHGRTIFPYYGTNNIEKLRNLVPKDLQIGGNIVGDTASNLSGFNSITATSFTGDGANLTNTGAQLSSATSGSERIVLTDKTSGTMTTAKTDSDLEFNFATNTLSCPTFSGAFSGNATTSTTATNVVGTANRILFNNNTDTTTTSAALTFNGTQLNVTNNIRANNLTFGLTSGTTINTATGDLILDSSNNKVHITANAEVDGTLNVDSSTNSSSKDTGALILTAGGLGVEGNIHAGGAIHAGGDIFAFSSSDIELKQDISPIENALDMVNSLSGNTFAWKPEANIFGNKGMDTGIIAQEVEALGLPGVAKRRGDGTLGVRYDRLVPVLIEAVKELTAKVKSLESNK